MKIYIFYFLGDGGLGHHSGHIVSDEMWTLTSGAALSCSVFALVLTSAIMVITEL